jgi:hypothetical protein
VDGVYITLQLRSNSGIPVPNTRVVIKNNMGEVADGRTDADGNALLFVPSNENLKLNIINDHVVNGISIPLKEEDLGSFSTSTVKTFTMQDRVDLVTIYGKAFNCDGTPLKSGTAVLSSSYQIAAKDAYATSIVDGAFKFMNWITWNYDLGTVVLKDNSGKAMDTTNIMLGVNYPDRPYRIDMNIYACKNAPQLFCNYRIDTTSYSISVNATANSPVLTEAYTDLSYPNIITIDNNGQGIIFQGYFPEVGGNYFYYSSVQGLPTGLKINGVDYAFDPRSEITITRRDPDYGGIVEGRFSVNYGGTHNISGNFRVKRVSYK